VRIAGELFQSAAPVCRVDATFLKGITIIAGFQIGCRAAGSSVRAIRLHGSRFEADSCPALFRVVR
jgi:hypothetical protein